MRHPRQQRRHLPGRQAARRRARPIGTRPSASTSTACSTHAPRRAAMVERRSGAIVNLASWMGKSGVAAYGAYCASKFAVVALTQSLACELGEHGVRVNAVAPGLIVNTKMRDESEAKRGAEGLPLRMTGRRASRCVARPCRRTSPRPWRFWPPAGLLHHGRDAERHRRPLERLSFTQPKRRRRHAPFQGFPPSRRHSGDLARAERGHEHRRAGDAQASARLRADRRRLGRDRQRSRLRGACLLFRRAAADPRGLARRGRRQGAVGQRRLCRRLHRGGADRRDGGEEGASALLVFPPNSWRWAGICGPRWRSRITGASPMRRTCRSSASSIRWRAASATPSTRCWALRGGADIAAIKDWSNDPMLHEKHIRTFQNLPKPGERADDALLLADGLADDGLPTGCSRAPAASSPTCRSRCSVPSRPAI